MSEKTTRLSGGRSLKEMKNLEWIFIAIHTLGVPAVIAMGFLHDPTSPTTVALLAGLFAAWNAIAAFMNHRIGSIDGQGRLGIISLAAFAVFAWTMIFQFLPGEQTAAYSGFAIVIIEGAVRFGLIGSLVMAVVFAVVLAIAMQYRQQKYDWEFNVAGYAYWTVLLFFIAISVGLVNEETKRERRRRETAVKERTLLEERHRIARDLHDTVLKTLHGLSLEAHALKRHVDSPVALEKAEYIQGVCQRSSQQIRDIIDELRSEGESEGIASQMSRMVEVWSKNTGIKADFTLYGEDRTLSLLASHNLRNVLSEALTNIHKHASASRVVVSLELLPGELRLEIADNGKGIGSSGGGVYDLASQGKYGILGMKERVEQLNGQFSVDNSGGTRLVISVPLVSA